MDFHILKIITAPTRNPTKQVGESIIQLHQKPNLPSSKTGTSKIPPCDTQNRRMTISVHPSNGQAMIMMYIMTPS